MPKAKKTAKRPNTTRSEADWKALGFGSVKLRLPQETIDMLSKQAEVHRVPRHVYAQLLVEAAEKSLVKGLTVPEPTPKKKRKVKR